MSTLGEIVDGLGCPWPDDNGDVLISDALVLVKVVLPDGSVSMRYSASDGMSWVEKLGMLTAATELQMRSLGGSSRE